MTSESGSSAQREQLAAAPTLQRRNKRTNAGNKIADLVAAEADGAGDELQVHGTSVSGNDSQDHAGML